jgi:hypothetical protein
MQTFRMLWLLGALVACEKTATIGTPTVERRFPVAHDLDVLFVIDNSASTADKQALFAQNFATLADHLDASADGRPNLHIGVVSTTVGTGSDVDFGSACRKTMPSDDGLLQNTAQVSGCSPPNGRFISDLVNGQSGRTTNYPGTLAQAFSCIAQLGTSGCGFEAPLEAMKRALDGSRPENAGFLRDDADLAVIILTDEDDCSVADPAMFALNNVGPGDFRCQPLMAYDCTPAISASGPGSYTGCTPRHDGYLANPASYVAFLHTIKDPSQVFVGLIAGDPTPSIQTGPITVPFIQQLALLPSCTTTISGNTAIARPALRLDEFRHDIGDDQSVFQSVCQSDYSAALGEFGDDMMAMMSPCFPSTTDLRDVAPENPGIQLPCKVSEVQFMGGGEIGVDVPACTMIADNVPAPSSPLPCWWAMPQASCGGSGLAVQVVRSSPPPVGTVVDVVCSAAQ